MQFEFDGNSFGFRQIIKSFFKYKWINLLIILFALIIGILYYYLKQPLYQSNTTIEISTNPKSNRIDFFEQKNNNIVQGQETATEIDILKSDFLLIQTLKSIQMNVEYFKEYKYKKRVIYEESPFRVSSVKTSSEIAFNQTYIVKHVDQNRFELFLKRGFFSTLLDSTDMKNTIYNYGQRIELSDCSFIIKKTKRFKRAIYSFSLSSPESIMNSIKKRLSIKTASIKSSVLKISYQDYIAKRAKDFLNKFIQNYLQYSKTDMIEVDNKTLQFINQQLGAVSSKLENSENLLQVYKKSQNISDLNTHQREVVQRLNEFEAEYKNAQIEFDVIKRLHRSVKNGKYNIIASIGLKYPLLDNMLRTLERSKIKKEEKLTLFTENHPDVISLTNTISDTKYAILQTSTGIYNRAQERIKSIKNVVGSYTKKLKELPNIEKELVKYKRHFTVNDKIYNYLLKKRSELSIEKASITLNKKVLDFAREFKKPINPKFSIVIPLSLLLGLILAIFHSILRDKFDTKIKNKYDISRLTDIPIFGLIPFVKDSKNYNVAYALDKPNSSESEAIREIKNNLEYLSTSKKSKIILVTSAVPNEGKTTISANLAAVLGMGEKRSILLSLDLRRPELHHKFSLSNIKGMSDVLSDKIDINEVIWENEKFNNLNIVTSGLKPPNPAELIAGEKMKNVIEKLRDEYDYIILDTPPFKYVNDSISLLKLCDIALFIVKSEFSEEKYVKDIDTLVRKMGVKNAGIILNSVKDKYKSDQKFDYRYIYHEA